MKRLELPLSGVIAADALSLISDPARFTTGADARDADGNNVAGGTDQAVAWSCLGAVNRVAVLNHNRDVAGWVELLTALKARGVDHYTPHAEAIAALKDFA